MSLETLARAVALLLSSYLLLRAAALLLRVRWARRAYPSVAPTTTASTCAPDRARGALLGAAIGDAIGLPAESLPPWLIRLRYPSGPRPRHGILRFQRLAGEISDDTQLLICIARSIDPAGRYLHLRFLDELRLWHGYRIAAGRTCSSAAVRLRVNPERASGLESEGNGAAMRVAPLAVAHAREDDPRALLADVDENARATHTAPLAVAAARLVALVIWRSLRMPDGEASTPLSAGLPVLCHEAGFPLELALRVPEGPPSGRVTESIPAALAPLLDPALAQSAPRARFERAMAAAFAAGGDVDSIAAIVGAALGARHGMAALPEEWVSSTLHHRYLRELADRLSTQVHPEASGVIAELEGELALREVDAIVNAWNRNLIPSWLLVPQGVSRAIRRHGGRSAIREISRRSPMPLGSAWETAAGALPARWVIHVAGIDLLWRASEASVRLSARNALLLARCLGAESVALPLIGSGSGGLQPARGRAIILAAMEEQRSWFDRLELVHSRR